MYLAKFFSCQNKLKSVWKESLMTSFKVLFLNFSVGSNSYKHLLSQLKCWHFSFLCRMLGFGPEADYPVWYFWYLLSVSADKCWDKHSIPTTLTLFHAHQNSLFSVTCAVIHAKTPPFMWKCIIFTFVQSADNIFQIFLYSVMKCDWSQL